MFGFGILLMHLSDYFARRRHDKNKRKSGKTKKQQLGDRKKYCDVCGKAFVTGIELGNHKIEAHSDITS